MYLNTTNNLTLTFDVLLPAFNAESTIRKTLESIADQTIMPVKVIIIVNGCNDLTEVIVDQFSAESILDIRKIVFEKNIGLVGALNKGLESCSSRWVARIDADDHWRHKHLENLSCAIETGDSKLALIAGSSLIFEDGNVIGTSPALKDLELRDSLQKDNPFVHSAVAYKLDAIREVGGYRAFCLYEDYDLWIRLLSKYKAEIIVSEMCVHVKSSNTLTASYAMTDALEERLRLQVSAFKAFGFLSLSGVVSIITTSLRVALRKYLLAYFKGNTLLKS